MDPSSKHKTLLRSKIKKRRRLVLVESLDKGKQTLFVEPEKEVEKEIDIKPIIKENKKPTPLTLKIENTVDEVDDELVDEVDDEVDDGVEEVKGEDIDIKLKGNTLQTNIETKKMNERIETDGSSETMEKVTKYIYEPDLNTNMDDLSKIKPGEKFYICIYQIVTDGLKPFIQYCFHKDKSDILSFPVLKNKGTSRVDVQGTEFINHIFKQSPPCSFFTRIREGHNYLFYNVSYIKSEHAQFMLRKSHWWWALMSEIVNHKKVITFSFAQNVYPIFLNNPSLIYLKNERNNVIELPEIGFHGTYFDLLNFISIYGLRPSTLNSMMGPYYYFGSFRKAVRYAGWTSTYKPREIDGKMVTDSEGRYDRGGIARFAMFLGKNKVFLNHHNERNDYSEFVEKKIREQPQSKRWEELVIKLHDHDGKWAEEYDSCYVGRVKLANGGLFMKNPEFILKHFAQQHILTTHELDKSTLKRNWDGNYENYNIL